MPRMQILTTQEQENFDKPPLFDHMQRKQLFNLPQKLLNVARSLRSPVNQMGFLLLCGYFIANKRFFLPHDFHERDIAVVAGMLGYSASEFIASDYSKGSKIRHQQIIAEYYGFKTFDKAAKAIIKLEINSCVSHYLKPRLIFERCSDCLIQKRIVLPQSWALCELIRESLQSHKHSLILKINNYMAPETEALLDSLFVREDKKQSYQLTLLKKLSQSINPAKVREYVADFHNYRMQDNLINIFLSVMTAFQTTIANEHKEKALERQQEKQNQLQFLIQNLETDVFSVMHKIRTIANDNVLADSEKVHRIKGMLNRKTSSNIENIHAEFLGVLEDEESVLYELKESKSLHLQNRLSPVLKAVNFLTEQPKFPLMEAIGYFQDKEGNITQQTPIAFLDEKELKALYREDGTFRTSLYKVFLFQHIAAAIKSGRFNLAHSYKYLPLDKYMISKKRWAEEKHQLLERAGLLNFLDSKAVLQQLDQALYAQYIVTNERAAENEYLSFKTDGSFHIKTPALDSQDTDPLQTWFPKRHYIPLAEILETVHHHSGMLSALEHWQQTHTSQATSRPALLAGIVGLGCGIGVRKMARISSHVSENELDHTVNWRFSLDNVREANDRVLTVMDKMELPNIYRSNRDKLHTASDGQKFEVRGESLIATRSSFKYFGQGQGVSAYTFVDERHLLWHSTVISASDRESAYVIDGLMHNDVVKSDIHSTDTHGYSEAIFGLTHMLGFSFAPRLKGLKNMQLYIFKHHDKAKRKTWQITPDNYVNEKQLHQNWDDLLRLVTTIKLKENTASDIFQRLNSYSRQHTLYQTIKSFGQTIKSLFILRYINEVELRQAIEKQLNKVELANRFTRAVAVGSPREFMQVEKEEQEIAESCNRLIKNSIICWHYLYLSHKLRKMNDDIEKKEQLLSVISTHSVITWAHINMLGEYDFSEEKRKDSVGILPPKMAA